MKISFFSPLLGRKQRGEKTKTSAFTLVEILIAVTIISIIGVASISSFSRLADLGASDASNKSIASTIESLDRDIAARRISSYEATFESGSIGFWVNRDFYKKTSPVKLTFYFSEGRGMLLSTHTSTGTWFLDFFRDGRKDSSDMMVANGAIWTFLYPTSLMRGAYEVYNSLEDTELNSFLVQYYNDESDRTIVEKQIVLRSIDCSWVQNTLIIQNILGDKKLITSWSSGWSSENCDLIFDKNGKESRLEVRK